MLKTWAMALTLMLGGCSGIELSPVNPPGVDLSGTWLIDFSASDLVGDLRSNPQSRQILRRESSQRRETRRIATGSGLAFVAHDFQVLGADKLQIELNRDSMGIQYQPGVYRDVTWGERQRGLWKAHAGWEERDLVIVSQAKDLEVVERFVRSSPNTLEVHVFIEADGDKAEYIRTFNRRP